MDTLALPHKPQNSDQDSLILASLIFREANRTVAGVHAIVAALLHYALIGAAITNNLIELTVSE